MHESFTIEEYGRLFGRGEDALATEEPEFPFSEEEYQRRLEHMRQHMAEQEIDLLYVTAPDSMCYFHGYMARWYRGHSPSVWPPLAGTAIHVDHDRLIHFDFPMEEILLKRTSVARDIRFMPNDERIDTGLPFIMRELKAEGWLDGTVGMEFWSHIPNRAVSDAFEAAFIANGCRQVVDATRPIRAIRRVKSSQEIAYMQEAARICDVAHETVKEVLRPGVTELEVYGEATKAMARAGGETSGIIGAISSGPYIAGHALNSRRVIQQGDMVLYDPCGVYNCYHANLSRGYFLGEPPDLLVKLYDHAGHAMELLPHIARAGKPIPEVCHELRRYYQDVGIWELRGWVGGYELGIAFPPDWVGEFVWTVEEDTEGTFLENEVTNFESIFNTYLVDTFVYEGQGARRLSTIPPDLIVID
jgi:Xaa-Pro dipeptidase